MEGCVYRCGWEKRRGGFSVWLLRKSRIRADGRTLNAAIETLQGEVCGQLGDGEAVLDFEPPLPAAENTKRFLEPRIVECTGNEGAALDGDKAEFFTKGVCRKCNRGLGRRTATPLRLNRDSFSTATDGGFVRGAPMISFFSDRFRALLSKTEQARFEWISLEVTGRCRRRFFELRCKRPIPPVPVRGLPFHTSVCEECRAMSPWILFKWNMPLHDFICREDLPKVPASCFGVGEGLEVSMCFPLGRWRELAGRSGTGSIHASDIGVVRRNEIDPNPPIFGSREYEKLSRACSRDWERLRDRWMKSSEVKAHVAAGGDAIDLIHEKVAPLLTFRALNQRLKLPEWKPR